MHASHGSGASLFPEFHGGTGFPVVALCTSAGGLDALTRVLWPLPRDFPAAVIVSQHLRPSVVSRLPELLQRHCDLTVRPASDGDRLTPGHVLVVPEHSHMLVGADDRVRLIASGELPPARPSADLLLATMAVALGPRAIAVILTGGGRDGSVGVLAIGAFGGSVLVQNPDTAFAPGMPRAALESEGRRSTALDHIAASLVDLVTR
jgi:two-component system, chemotaxis family, protein-glutamate methylesterase/glutaminase